MVKPSAGRRIIGRTITWLASGLFALLVLLEILDTTKSLNIGFSNWRPVLYAYGIWCVAIGISQVLTRGENGYKALFVLPAALFTVAVVVFPLLFALYISTLNWNLSSALGSHFTGLSNYVTMFHDPHYWEAMANMVFYLVAVLVEYAIAFGLALLLNAEIRGRKFFRVVFIVPFMLSPIAVSWMIGKSLMQFQFGPLVDLLRHLGWQTPAFFADPWTARLGIELMDAWKWIPLMIILLLAGLQSMSTEVLEAAEIDGATAWQKFRRVIFPLMLPVSTTTLIIRIIFKLKLAGIIISVTAGGPGGATDSVSSYIHRVYGERGNVGYGTALAVFYLFFIIILLMFLLKFAERLRQKYS